MFIIYYIFNLVYISKIKVIIYLIIIVIIKKKINKLNVNKKLS